MTSGGTEGSSDGSDGNSKGVRVCAYECITILAIHHHGMILYLMLNSYFLYFPGCAKRPEKKPRGKTIYE